MSLELPELALLCAPSFRSRAYVQALAAAGLRPARCFLLPGAEPAWHGPTLVEADLRGDGRITAFRPGLPLADSLDAAGIPALELPLADINAEPVRAALSRRPETVIVYSGVGGALVGREALRLGKRFLHVHGGYVPDYRGSTAFYFSILREGRLGASALWLDEGIDTGPVLARRSYPVVPGLEVDRLGDPLVRADLLREVLERRARDGRFPEAAPVEGASTTYHVVHPVLKHLALRRCGLVEGAR